MLFVSGSKEGIGQQRRFEGLSIDEVAFMDDSLRTPEQKEFYLTYLRVVHTNRVFRGDSIAFLLDKDGFLSEGLPESAYLVCIEDLKQFNALVRNAQPHRRQRILSTKATFHAAYLKFFGYEYSGDVPLLEYTNDAKPGELPNLKIKNGIYAVTRKTPWPGSPVVDSVKVIPK